MCLRLLFIALSFAVLNGCAGFNAAPRQVRLLQINDTYKIEGLEHGQLGGLARVRALRKQLEADGTPVLLLHAGDLLFPSVASKYLKGAPMIQTLNRLDGVAQQFDPRMVATFGNHEFDDRDAGVLFNRLAQSEFTWVSTNVTLQSLPGNAVTAQPPATAVVDLDGVKVGVFGLTLDITQPSYVQIDYQPRSVRRERVVRALAALRQQGAQLIVALTHQNLPEDEWLAQEFPEIQVIAGGHEHFFIQKQVGNAWITKADADAASAVLHDLTVQDDGQISDRVQRYVLDAAITPDPEVAHAVDEQLKQFEHAFEQANGRSPRTEIGQTAYRLEGLETAVRGKETALGDVLTDLIRRRLNADVAVLNGGAIRLNDNIPPGPISAYDLDGIVYHDGEWILTELSGAQIVAMLRNSVSLVHVGDGRFLQVSGLRFRYHVDADGVPLTEAIHVNEVEIAGPRGWRPVQLDTRYRVALPEYLWNRGVNIGFAPFNQGKRLNAGPSLSLRQALLDELARLPDHTLRTDVDGRIEKRVETAETLR